MPAQMRDTEVGRTLVDWNRRRPHAKTPGRTSILAVGATLALAGGVVSAAFLRSPTEASQEPDTLLTTGLADSFGIGADVDWPCPQTKRFHFSVSSPLPAAIVLRYASTALSDGEVEVTLNGISQGFLAADAPGTRRPLLLSTGHVRWGERNDLVFTNTKATDALRQESWKISDLRLELVPIPDRKSLPLLTLAERSVRQAEQWLQQREAGEGNLFRAWKTFRWVWILLESAEPRPELYLVSRSRMDELTRALDQQCGRMMLAVHQAQETRNPRKARQLLEDVLRHFPGTEHPCQNRALERLEGLQSLEKRARCHPGEPRC